MKIAYIFTSGRIKRLSSLWSGEISSDFFYGAKELSNAGHLVDMLEVDLSAGFGIRATLLNVLAHHDGLPSRVSGELLMAIYRSDIDWGKYDVVVATHSGVGFALALLGRGFLRLPPIVSIHCGLLNYSHPYMIHRWQVRLLHRMQTILFASSELDGLIAWDARLTERIQVCEFGVDTSFWTPDHTVSRETFVLSVGHDVGRDYDTLLQAVSTMTQSVKILTSRKLPSILPKHVEHINGGWHKEGISDSALRNLYRSASCVVIPLHDIFQPSGQSVCLQAMACGCPVVMSQTKGLWDRTALMHGETLWLCKPEDRQSLADVIQYVLAHPDKAKNVAANALQLVNARWRIDLFARGVEKACMKELQVSKGNI